MNFSYKNYKNLLIKGIETHDYITFCELKKCETTSFILLRHDIDIDLEKALKIAQLESQLSIRSTFFLMLRSPVYNLFSRENHTLAKKIKDLGHEIAIHYDQGYYPFGNDIEDLISSEVEILNRALQIDVKAISFHQPGPKVLDNIIQVKDLVNTYDKDDMKGIHYISDSNMSFKRDPFTTLDSFNKIQLLTHPVWWGGVQGSTETKWDNAMVDSFERTQRQLLETERAYGKKRSFHIKHNLH
jgi:hypothetical protein